MITITNSPGTVDQGYLGEIGAIVLNLSGEPFQISHGDKICQAVPNFVPKVTYKQAPYIWENLSSDRNNEGFGSSGLK